MLVIAATKDVVTAAAAAVAADVGVIVTPTAAHPVLQWVETQLVLGPAAHQIIMVAKDLMEKILHLQNFQQNLVTQSDGQEKLF